MWLRLSPRSDRAPRARIVISRRPILTTAAILGCLPVLSALGASDASPGALALVANPKAKTMSLVRVDSHLHTLRRPRLTFASTITSATLSPGGALLGLVAAKLSKKADARASFRLVATQKLSAAGSFPLGKGVPFALDWVAPDRALVFLGHFVVKNPPPPDILVVDPAARKVIGRTP